MARNRLDKARRLRQRDAIWHGTARRAPTWIMPRDRPPYRPYLVLVLDQETEQIRRIDIQQERFTPDRVLDELLKAMRRPLLGSGGRYKPARIILDDAELVRALAPMLADIDVGCDYRPTSPLVTAALRELEARMTKREPVPGLLTVPGVTEPLAHELFAAAADYYRQAPWRWLDNESPIEVRYPAKGRAQYAVVLGSGGEVFGLSLYESTDELGVLYSTRNPGDSGRRLSWFSLVFEAATAMAFDDLDAMEKYGWPVAGDRAYPIAIKADPPDVYSVPSVSEIRSLAAALRVIPDFVTRRLQADHGGPRSIAATYPLPDVHGDQKITLRYSIDLLESVARSEREAR